MSHTNTLLGRVAELLDVIYKQVPDGLAARLVAVAEAHRAAMVSAPPIQGFDERTAFLITYGDTVSQPGTSPLRALSGLLSEFVGDLLTDVHLLPFFTWTSDDGFGVVDHRTVNPAVGSWSDVHALGAHYDLAFDFVANHTSASSPWFQAWLAGDPAMEGFYITQDAHPNTSQVVRPRTTPLFHSYTAPDGTVHTAWTTFGPDQVDVNVATPAVLLELTDVLLGYLRHGATTVRLDAIGYLVKESGTSCIHLPATHAVVKLWRVLLDHARPGARLLTETNVPHADNIAYFGNGSDEAHMVYQFALPPLVLHAFVAGDTRPLSRWASTVGPVSDTATWFNFLASHDGIGVRPTHGLLSDEDRQALVDRVISHGGHVTLADQPDGSRSPYELNISYLDALCTVQEACDATTFTRKAVAAHNILVSVVGVPAIYLHSLLGSRSDLAGAQETGITRRINRALLDLDTVREELRCEGLRRSVLQGILDLLAHRRDVPSFSPWAGQQVLQLDHRVFAVRRSQGHGPAVLSLTNVTDQALSIAHPGRARDLLDGSTWEEHIDLPPFGLRWLTEDGSVGVSD